MCTEAKSRAGKMIVLMPHIGHGLIFSLWSYIWKVKIWHMREKLQQNCKSERSHNCVMHNISGCQALNPLSTTHSPFMTSPSVFLMLLSYDLPLTPPCPVHLFVKHAKTHIHTLTLSVSLITSPLHSVVSGQSRSEVFIFSHPLTKQLVLPPTLKDTLSVSVHPRGPAAFKLRARLPLPRRRRNPHHVTAAMATAGTEI